VDVRKENDFDAAAVNAGVAGTRFAGAVHHLASVGSTNAVAIEAAQQGARVGVWVADEQTAGRGRGGHRWHSAVGEGLYLSVLIRPALAGVDVLKLSLAAGLAARTALVVNAYVPADSIDLRWPNDLMLWSGDGVERKFGGILTESAIEAGTGALAYAVIGIGMNLNQVELPEDLRAIGTSLRMEGAGEVARGPLVSALLHALDQEIGATEREAHGPADHVPALAVRFAEASTWLHGLAVQVAEDDGYTGVTAGLDQHGLLQVRLEDGSQRTVRHGGVRRRAG
jgi:BirA family biotin operon repressor/biotin-[acetyl-CoA-carboxylase] ligase